MSESGRRPRRPAAGFPLASDERSTTVPESVSLSDSVVDVASDAAAYVTGEVHVADGGTTAR